MSREELCNRLGIPLVNDKSELKPLWRKLVLKYHPDRNKDPNAEKTFIQIQKLFQALEETFNEPITNFEGISITINGYNIYPTSSSTTTNFTWST